MHILALNQSRMFICISFNTFNFFSTDYIKKGTLYNFWVEMERDLLLY